MANRATVTYNGSDISTEDREGNFDIQYNGSTLTTIGAGQSKTLNCKDKVMLSNVVVGGKTLLCKAMKMASDIVIAVKSLFPSEPSSYSLIGTYTSSQTWAAPETGYFQIEVFGASGKGGNYEIKNQYAGYGGGGGGGGYACSRVKLNKGDTVAIVRGSVGSTTSATINSSIESYSQIKVTSGANGGTATADSTAQTASGGTGGAGGTASGGNYANKNGNRGTTGTTFKGNFVYGTDWSVPYGGTTGHTGGNNGGDGGYSYYTSKTSRTPVQPKAGSAGFIKIYRGNTNLL